MKVATSQTIIGGALLSLLPALSSASPLPPQDATGDALSSPPPMWNIRCPRDIQDYCTPDNRLFYCTVNGELRNQLSASCAACVCRDGSGGRP
ncbi:hypothetical protein RB601_002926 [Gaeumannomyces tritici]